MFLFIYLYFSSPYPSVTFYLWTTQKDLNSTEEGPCTKKGREPSFNVANTGEVSTSTARGDTTHP